jgi:hypothetical protein
MQSQQGKQAAHVVPATWWTPERREYIDEWFRDLPVRQ